MQRHTDYWFIGLEKVVTINAIIKNGKLIDWNTEQWIDLPDWARIKLTIPESYLVTETRKNLNEIQKFKLLEKDSELFFMMNIPNKLHPTDLEWREFRVKILGDLILERKGNKLGTLLWVLCEVYNEYNEMITSATSLNQAYTLTSVLVRPDAKTHNANVFRVFTYNRIYLNRIRDQIAERLMI